MTAVRIALAAAALVAASMAQAQPPSPASQLTTTQLNRALGDYVRAGHGDPRWPAPTPAEYSAIADTGRRIDIAVELTSPTGALLASSPYSASARGAGSQVFGFADGGALLFRAREMDGGLTVLAALAAGAGAAPVFAERTGLSVTAPSRLVLAGGYAVTLTPAARQMSPDELAVIQSLASRVIGQGPIDAAAVAPPPPGSLPPPVSYSPLTNSVIRQGDPKGR